MFLLLLLVLFFCYRKMLDLSQNSFQLLSTDTFRDIVKVETLNLSYNSLAHLNLKTFVPIKKYLCHIYLDHNELSEMETSRLSFVLSIINKIETLQLSNNKLIFVPNLVKLTRLQTLRLENNQIESLLDPYSNERLLPTSLIELNLQNNRLTMINAQSFGHLKNMKYFKLANNYISAISESMFTRLVKLVHLDLSQNNIRHIPSRIFYTLANLKYLDLSAQRVSLTRIDEYAFDRDDNSNSIDIVNLSKNDISSIHGRAFCSRNLKEPFVNIEMINLSDNLLSELNVCIIEQLAIGYKKKFDPQNGQQNEPFEISYVNESDKPKPKLIFQTQNNNNKKRKRKKKFIDCSCHVMWSAQLAEIEGDCKRINTNLYEKMSTFNCEDNKIDNTTTTTTTTVKMFNNDPKLPTNNNLNEIKDYCLSFGSFDCSKLPQVSAKVTDIPSFLDELNDNSLFNYDYGYLAQVQTEEYIDDTTTTTPSPPTTTPILTPSTNILFSDQYYNDNDHVYKKMNETEQEESSNRASSFGSIKYQVAITFLLLLTLL
jgi:hypothetical protein